MLILPSVRGGSLGLLLLHFLLSLKVGMGPKQNYAEKSASTLKFYLKITGKPKFPRSSLQPGSSLNYSTETYVVIFDQCLKIIRTF